MSLVNSLAGLGLICSPPLGFRPHGGRPMDEVVHDLFSVVAQNGEMFFNSQACAQQLRTLILTPSRVRQCCTQPQVAHAETSCLTLQASLLSSLICSRSFTTLSPKGETRAFTMNRRCIATTSTTAVLPLFMRCLLHQSHSRPEDWPS